MDKKKEEPPKYPEVAKRMAQFIEESGEPNPRQFAIQAKLTPQKISYILQGKFMPGGDTLAALAAAYRNFDAIWLLTGRRTIVAADAPPTPSVETEPASPALERQPDYSSAPATVAEAENLLLKEQVLDLKTDKADLKEELTEARAEIRRLREALGKSNDSPDAAGPLSPNPRKPISGFMTEAQRQEIAEAFNEVVEEELSEGSAVVVRR